MAAVQRTPTPVDIRSRKAFIESMEEELKRVQDHLDRRQWRYRNGSVTSTTSLEPVQRRLGQPSRQWYTLARSNPASRKKRVDEGEVDESLVRVSSAQDGIVRTSSLIDSSSCSSKSPTPEPADLITRVRSPNLPLQSSQDASFSSPSPSDQGRSLTRDMLSSPNRLKSPQSFLYSLSLPQASNVKTPSYDETPLLVKEMPLGLMQSRLQQSPSDGATMHSYEDEEEEEHESETHREVVMPSAFGDLFIDVGTRESQQLEEEEEEEEEDTESSRSADDSLQRITPPLEVASLNRKDEDDEGLGKSSLTIQETSKVTDDSSSSSAYDFERYQRIQALKQEKERSEMIGIINDLKEQLREKEKAMTLLQERMHVEVKVREERIKKVLKQHTRLEKEKWDLLKKAREAAERSVNLRTKLELNETQLRSSIVELDRVNDELSSVKAANKSLRLMVSDLRNKAPIVEATTQTEVSSYTCSFPRVIPLNDSQTQTSYSSDGARASIGVEFEDWEDMLSVSSSQCDSRDVTPVNTPKLERGKTRRSMKKLLNRFRRTGSAGKQHSTSSLSKDSTAATSLDNLQLSQSSLISPFNHSRSASISSSSNRQSIASVQESSDPNQVLEEFKSIPFQQWNTRALVAWMEVVVGMPHYISNVRQHVTSGHAMLALGNSDLDKKLGISNALHRKRLRLAIEDRRTNSSSLLRPSHISDIDHNWVAYTWAVECGFPHLSQTLYNGMVNGKVLNSLTKEDLKKFFKIGKKTEQLSFSSGVELLQMHNFDREAIKRHRQATNNPLYWTNNDVYEWLRKTDLEMYAGNVIDRGVHGALLFLERGNFTSEHLASIIHIPPKSPLRKQLATHLAKLFSTEDITSLTEEFVEDEEIVEPHPQSARIASPDGLSPTSDGSPHPMRRMGLSHASSNPDVSEPQENPFERHSRERISLRESLLRSVITPQQQRNHIRPLSQVCSTTTV